MLINFSVVHNGHAIRFSVSRSHYCEIVVLNDHVFWQPPLKLDATFFFFWVVANSEDASAFFPVIENGHCSKGGTLPTKMICTRV